MPDARFYDIPGREVFDVGTWNGYAWTDADLDEMVANFDALKAMGYAFPIKISHDPEQRLISNSELPAAGYIARLYRAGSKLVADLTHVPGKVKDLIELGAYATVSAEIYPKVQLMGKLWKNVLATVAFLGGEIPAVGTLDDGLALYANAHTWPQDQQHVIATYTPAPRARSKEEGMTDKRSFGTALRTALGRLIAPRTHDLGEDSSIEERRRTIEGLLTAMWSPSWTYVQEMFDAYVIACRDSSYFQVPYSVADDGTVTIGEPITEVEQTWRPASDTSEPIANTAGATGRKTKEADMAISKAILTALGLPETADEPAALKALGEIQAERDAAKNDAVTFRATTERVAKLEDELRKRDAKDVVDAAIRAHKLMPSKREWATTFATKDPTAFAEWVKDAPELFRASPGSDQDAPEGKSAATQINELVVAEMKADGKLEFKAALDKVAREHPELAREYVESARRSSAPATA